MAERLTTESIDNALKPTQQAVGAAKSAAGAAGEVKKVKGVIEQAEDADDVLASVERIAKIADGMLGKFVELRGTFSQIAEKKGVFNEDQEAKQAMRDEANNNKQQEDKPQMPQKQDIQLEVSEEFTDEFVKTFGELLDNIPESYQEKTLKEYITMYKDDGFAAKMAKKRIKAELVSYAQRAVRIK